MRICYFNLVAASALLCACLSSCDDKNKTPNIPQENIEVKNLVVGDKDIPNSGIAYVYGHLSVQAEIIVNEGTIASIKMSAHQNNGGEGRFDEVELLPYFNKETNVLNVVLPTDDYEQIPLDQPTGEYVMGLIITLDDGKSMEFTSNFQVSDKPFLENFEMGSGHGVGEVNNHIGSLKVGDLHVETDIYCVMNQLKQVTIIIKSEDGKTELVNQVWDKSPYSNTRNTTFHEHPKFPDGTKPGNYIFKFIAEDKAGNTCTRELNLTIVEE